MIEIAATVACFMLFGLAIFQLFLALGYPIGRFAWGGNHTVLPKKLRIGSIVSILLYLVFAVFILNRVGIMDIINSTQATNIGIWILAAYFVLGILMNGISHSNYERAIMTPVALILAVCCIIIAIN